MCIGPTCALCGPERARDKVQTRMVQLRSVSADVATSCPIVKVLLCCQWEEGFYVCWGVIMGKLRLSRMGMG